MKNKKAEAIGESIVTMYKFFSNNSGTFNYGNFKWIYMPNIMLKIVRQ